MFRSSCAECIAAGVDPDRATWEHEDFEEWKTAWEKHAAEFHANEPEKSLTLEIEEKMEGSQ